MMTFISGFILGVFSLLGYMVWRMMRNWPFDSSNATNPLRVLSHVVLHPGDLYWMYYISNHDMGTIKNRLPVLYGRLMKSKPFWYINKDEITEVVKTRPPNAS